MLGHHAHILKGLELYRGRPILYSIGNFATDLRMDAAHAASSGFREIQKLHPRWIPDFGSLYNFPDDSRLTLLVKIALAPESRGALSLRPAIINRNAQPRLVDCEDPVFDEVRAFLDEAGAAAGLNGRCVVVDGELRLREACG